MTRQRNVLLPVPRKSRFNLSHNNKFTCDMGELIPFFCQEVVPGDTFKGQTQMKIDFMPQIKPVMHNVDVFTYYFYVPNRILWNDWTKFIIGGDAEADALVPPYINFNNIQESTLADYLGVPTGINNNLKISALPFRAYDFIYNEYFRHEDIQDELEFSLEGGEDTSTATNLLNICWEKDYFTTATKSQQYGDPVTMALAGQAPVIGDGKTLGLVGKNGQETGLYYHEGSDYHYFQPSVNAVGDPAGTENIGGLPSGTQYSFGVSQNADNSGLIADLSQVESLDISTFRLAMLLQSYYEKLNLSGHRYKEWIKSIFGENILDATLQKPEYLGGGKSPVIFSPVLQTSQSTDTSPQGNQSGYATAFHTSHSFTKHCNEHGWIIGIMALRPQSGYYQGVPKQLQKETRLDYLIPDFVGLSEQPIYNQELYAQGTDEDKQVFGYQERYSEYKQIENSVHGAFRTSLDFYHMDRKFSSLPTLSSNFVECSPTTRIWSVEDVEGANNDHLMIVAGTQLIADRPVPKYSLPSGLVNKSHY